MGTALGVLFALVAIASGVVLYLRRGILYRITAEVNAESLRLEQERVAKMQAAAAAERAARAKRFEDEAAAATDAESAAALLRDVIGGEDDPDGN